MAFYDVFANVYDASLERLYAPHRVLAAEALALEPSAIVLDVPCGTGQSFEVITKQLGPGGLLLGVDASAGMLRRARARSVANVCCVEGNAATLTLEQLASAAGRKVVPTRLHVFLGMSVFDDMQATFDNLWRLLAPGGSCVLVDVYTERLGVQGWLVNQIARADIRRKFWQPLEAVAQNFSRRDLPYERQHGGQIMLACGRKG
ncbi:MAG TPA: methyltransferase domain-containing protein [Polyangiales bacterium]|nr:methyltransferase domain-containing protein [Polyangiales bacterium]